MKIQKHIEDQIQDELLKRVARFKANGYNLTFDIIVKEGVEFIKVEAMPIATGMGAGATIPLSANIFDAIASLQFKLL